MIRPAKWPVRWFLRTFGYGGVALPPFGIYILAERITEESLIQHEKIHWVQYQRMGAIKYYLTYVWQVLRYGYWNAPMEREARGEING
jgi:hypothetical protein